MIKPFITTVIALFLLTSCGDDKDSEPLEVLTATPIPADSVTKFSGQKAYDHIVKLTSFGPRPTQSEGYQKSLAYLEETLHALGWKTKRNTFQALTPKGRVTFTNLLARYLPEGAPDWSTSTGFLVSGHLDTKLLPGKNFLGVNDSGSSTGVLLEIARVLAQNPRAALNVELVFFDGEEAFGENIIRDKDGLYGSTNYAKKLRKRKTKPALGIVIDLVGDPKVPLFVGGDSHPGAIAQARKATTTLGLDQAVSFPNTSIIDDHVPLLVYANLPVLHLIGDFQSMPYWHTPDDTLRHITPAALENTGKLTLQILHQMTN